MALLLSLMNQVSKLLAISGSLRAASSNSALLQAAATLAPAEIAVEIYGNMGVLPHFNPDDDGKNAPAVVSDLRARVVTADGLLICTPEYVHGLPGSFKNLLDWLVSGGELWDKPVAILRVAGRGEFADASLREILKTLMARVSVTEIALGTNKVSAGSLVEDVEIAAALRVWVEAAASEI